MGGLGFQSLGSPRLQQRGDRGITRGLRAQGLGFAGLARCRAAVLVPGKDPLLSSSYSLVFWRRDESLSVLPNLVVFAKEGPFFDVCEFVQAYTTV